MKRYTKNLTALLLTVIIILSSYLPTFAASQPTKYSKDSNSGERGVVCTTLNGTSASSYYTGSYAYDNLDDLTGGALTSTLKTLMKSTHTYTSSYNDCHYKADKTDCENNNGKVLLIYTSYSATQSQWNGWNREHVWPQSLGGGNTSGGGADLHHIRPSDASVNSSRGNKKYGNVDGGSAVKGNNPAKGVLGGYSTSTYFEPLDNVKGDIARICLYVYVRWGNEWGADSVTEVFQSVDVLLEWCALDPVDTWEMGRNEVVQGIQGNRNVFIDYPELAWLMFGKQIPANMTTPSGEAKESGGGSTTPPVCTHQNTTLKYAAQPTCGSNGYTGDSYCADCGVKLQNGSTIYPTGNHTFGEWTLNAAGDEESRSCSVCKKTETRTVGSDDPVDPPVDDPVDPPVDDPIDPPVDDPIDPPVDDPTDPIDPPCEPPVTDPDTDVTDADLILIYLILGAGESLFVGELAQ